MRIAPARMLRVEIGRLRMRRAVLLLVLACFLLPAFVWVSTYWNTRPVSQAELDQATVQLQRDRQEPGVRRQYERCLANPERYGVQPGDDTQQMCEEMTLPQLEWYLSRQQLRLQDEVTSSGPAVVVLLTLLMALIGTTFAGHDWNTGSMGNQLIFEPRRRRVWAAKGLAVVLGAALVGAVALAAYWGGLWLLAGVREVDVPAGVGDEITSTSARGLLLAVSAGFGAYALTMLFRSTVATLGVLFAVNLLAPLLLSVSGINDAERWMPHVNFSAVLEDGTTYFSQSAADSCGSGVDCGQESLSMAGGLLYFGVLLAVVVVVSVWSFRRRDVP